MSSLGLGSYQPPGCPPPFWSAPCFMSNWNRLQQLEIWNGVHLWAKSQDEKENIKKPDLLSAVLSLPVKSSVGKWTAFMERWPGLPKRRARTKARSHPAALSSMIQIIYNIDLISRHRCLTHASHCLKVLGKEQQITTKFLFNGTLSIQRH